MFLHYKDHSLMTPTDNAIQAALMAATEAKYGIEITTASAKRWCARAYSVRKKAPHEKLSALKFVISTHDPQHTVWIVNTFNHREKPNAQISQTPV